MQRVHNKCTCILFLNNITTIIWKTIYAMGSENINKSLDNFNVYHNHHLENRISLKYKRPFQCIFSNTCQNIPVEKSMDTFKNRPCSKLHGSSPETSMDSLRMAQEQPFWFGILPAFSSHSYLCRYRAENCHGRYNLRKKIFKHYK